MLPTVLHTDVSDFRQYAVWLISIVLIAIGFKYAKEIIAIVLDRLYQLFIKENPGL